MDYTGNVRTGGPADVRRLAGLTVAKLSVSAMDNNAYLLTCATTGAQLLVDAADDAPRLLDLVREGAAGHASDGSGRLDIIVTTHQHWDHHRALAELVGATRARTAAGAEDAAALPVRVDQRLRHADEVRFGDIALQVVHLRGHTPGSVALAYEEPGGRTHLWTGDSLFPGGVGNTHQDPELFGQLLGDVESRVFGVFGDDTWVYPGHGRDTTLGAERPHLREWRKRGW